MSMFLLGLLALAAAVAGNVEEHFNSIEDLTQIQRDTVAVATAHAEGRIVGGNSTDITLHPHQVSLHLRTNSTEFPHFHICGGSILSSTIVVTAAHCVFSERPSDFFVVAGSSQRSGSDGAIVRLKAIIVHEEFNEHTINNDIALLKLDPPLPLNNLSIKIIELDENVATVGAVATVTGWGQTGNGLADILQEVRVPVVSNEVCQEDYNKTDNGSKKIITDGMLCAGLRGIGGKDSCQMDSGGPLVINGKLAGVVSWGTECAHPNYPGVYARISYFRSWLVKKIAQYQ